MIQLSASKLGILKECPRCFWDANNSKFIRPRGIFSSFCLNSSPDRAVETITRAVEILKGKRPLPAPDCEYCKFGLMYPREEKNNGTDY